MITYLQETARAPESAGRCREQAVTHARAAGQPSQRGQPSRGSGPGSAAALGGHRFPEWWEEKVLESLPGSWQQELSREGPPAALNTPNPALTQDLKMCVVDPVEGWEP